MHYRRKDIDDLDRVTRLKVINSVTGIKPANLIGTIDKEQRSNLAIFSSVIHLGSNPALVGFISRPQTDDVGHTLTNIIETGCYTINHIHPEFIKNAHYTSGKFSKKTSEFHRCGLTEEFFEDFNAPFVKESNFKMGLRFKEKIDISLNNTILVIGEIVEILMPDLVLLNDDIDLQATCAVGISGLNSYYSLNKIQHFPYVRINEVPEF